MIQAVLFDFDGTLVDTISADIFCLKVIHKACGVSCPVDEFIDVAVDEIMNFHSLVDKGSEDPLAMHQFRLKNALSRYHVPWDQRLVTLYQNTMIEQTTPFTGVNRMLAAIRDRDRKLALISNAYDSEDQQRRIEHSGLAAYFDEIIISGEVGHYKPSTEIFHLTLQRLGLPAEKTVYIGDLEEYDISGAKAAGMQAILLCRNGKPLSTRADHICHSINELQQYIVKLLR